MADNTTLNPGSGGDIIATDDIGGIKHQRVKVQHGADGAASDVSATSPLPVVISGDGKDVITDAALVLDYPHHELHQGNMYTLVAHTGGATATALALAFRLPAGTKRMHAVVEWKSSGAAHLDIVEGATWDTGSGSAVNAVNHNRNSANTSQVEGDATGSFVAGTAVQDPTTIAGGTIIHQEYEFAGNQESVAERSEREWILKNDETHVVRLVSDDGAEGLWLAITFYEHTDVA